MKLVRIMAIAALATGVSTAAYAGGYSFDSVGGNFGKWAYADGASNGEAKVYGFKEGETWSDGGANTETKKEYKVKEESSGCGYYCSKSTTSHKTKTTAYGASGNTSGFKTDYGYGSAQSHSSAVAGSGVGTGFGFKKGNFEPKSRRHGSN